MAATIQELDDKHIAFIEQQHLFFVGTAGAEGTVNVSPKGLDTLRIVDNRNIAWLNLTGSGNETAAHVRENGRITLMFCSFDKQPLILRIYGTAAAMHPRDTAWQEYLPRFHQHNGARQILLVRIEQVQTSCGYAVPHYEYQGERETLNNWTEKMGPDGIRDYWQQENQTSLDGKPTHIIDGE